MSDAVETLNNGSALPCCLLFAGHGVLGRGRPVPGAVLRAALLPAARAPQLGPPGKLKNDLYFCCCSINLITLYDFLKTF